MNKPWPPSSDTVRPDKYVRMLLCHNSQKKKKTLVSTDSSSSTFILFLKDKCEIIA